MTSHQKTTSYCLQIQKEQAVDLQNSIEKQMQAQKENYERQLRELRETYEEKLTAERQMWNEKIQEILLSQIQSQQKDMVAIASQPTTTNNIKYEVNLAVLNEDEEYYTEFFQKIGGRVDQIIYMDDLVDRLSSELKDDDGNPRYICTDIARGAFKYKDKNNVIHKDPKAVKLISIIQKPMNNTLRQKYEYLKKSLADIEDKYDDEYEKREAQRTLCRKMDVTTELFNLMRDSTNIEFCKRMSVKCCN